MLAFSKAYELGVDSIELDVRESSDGELIIIHDASLDRTTNGTGLVNQNKISELRRLNASYWQGPHDSGRRMSKPSADVKIPTLEEVLTDFAGKVGLNIQLQTLEFVPFVRRFLLDACENRVVPFKNV